MLQAFDAVQQEWGHQHTLQEVVDPWPFFTLTKFLTYGWVIGVTDTSNSGSSNNRNGINHFVNFMTTVVC